MRPHVSEHLFTEVSALVRRMDINYLYYGMGVRPPALDRERAEAILPDVARFRAQSYRALRTKITQMAGFLKDEGPMGERLPVLVQIPNSFRVMESYEKLLEDLQSSRMELFKVNAKEAEEIFIHRLSEFLAVSSSPTTPPTVVNSNRGGDTVLYAKGYFLSTGTALGVSTPATGALPSGRYSFGILDNGTYRFENIVWTCPATVRLNLP